MNVYIAAPLACARDARDWALTLIDHGHNVVSSWHAPGNAEEESPDDYCERRRILDVNTRDLDKADVVMALMRTGTPKAVYSEIGWALAWDIPVVWLHGPRIVNRCIYDAHALSHIAHSPTRALEILEHL